MAHSSATTELKSVRVRTGEDTLVGDLTIPADAMGVALFAHGSGSSRLSPRNQFVARALDHRGLATLLIDLLTPSEEALDQWTSEYRFDISLLARRLVGIVDWIGEQKATSTLPLGLFGASTGAAAALIAAAQRPSRLAAVVSRGGRPDLAGEALRDVAAPTLLIVGARDTEVISMNRDAMRQMRCEKTLAIVPGASHLFEEPGSLEQVARLAGDWFVRHFRATDRHRFSRSTTTATTPD